MIRAELQAIKSTRNELRKFGFTMSVVLVLVAAFLFWKQKPSTYYFLYVGLAFGALGFILPQLLRPVYYFWMALAVLLGFVMTRVILTLLYFGLFTPIAVLVRLLGKDLLEERWNKNAETYWSKRPSAPFDPKSAENMF